MHMASSIHNSKITAVRLPCAIVQKIDVLVGKGNRSKFISAAIEKELKRKARLDHISKSEGFIDDGLDTLSFVNHLRASDERMRQ